MKKFSIMFLTVLVFIFTLQVTAEESGEEVSQFSLFMSERGLPYSEEIIPRMVNTELNALPPSLKEAFDTFGARNLPMLIDDTLLPTGVRRTSNTLFTGPFYVFAKMSPTEKLDTNEFRKSFSYEPIFAYIIQGDEHPIGVVWLKYADEKYEFLSAFSSTIAITMLEEINQLSSSDLSKAMNDVIFLAIGPERYAFSNEDIIKATYSWTPEAITFDALVKADYVARMELLAMSNGSDEPMPGGGVVSTHFYDADKYIARYTLSSANFTPVYDSNGNLIGYTGHIQGTTIIIDENGEEKEVMISGTPLAPKGWNGTDETGTPSSAENSSRELYLLRFVIGNNYFHFRNTDSKYIDTPPFIHDGRAMIPLRIVAEALGAGVDWNGDTRTVTVVKNNETISLTVDIPLPDDMGTPIIADGFTFVPVRYIAETLGATVQWDEAKNAVYIYE